MDMWTETVPPERQVPQVSYSSIVADGVEVSLMNGSHTDVIGNIYKTLSAIVVSCGLATYH